MQSLQRRHYCYGCGVEISWAPHLVFLKKGGALRQFEYCCEECYQTSACHCAERQDWDDERRKGSQLYNSLPR